MQNKNPMYFTTLNYIVIVKISTNKIKVNIYVKKK